MTMVASFSLLVENISCALGFLYSKVLIYNDFVYGPLPAQILT